MKEGGCGFRPNERVATALVLEGNLGLRISDIIRLRLCDIVNDPPFCFKIQACCFSSINKKKTAEIITISAVWSE